VYFIPKMFNTLSACNKCAGRNRNAPSPPGLRLLFLAPMLKMGPCYLLLATPTSVRPLSVTSMQPRSGAIDLAEMHVARMLVLMLQGTPGASRRGIVPRRLKLGPR